VLRITPNPVYARPLCSCIERPGACSVPHGRPAEAGFICLGNATGTVPPTATGGGASATGAGNVACGTNANANGAGSSNAALGNGANARGMLSANTATGTDADASGGGSRRSPMATSPTPAAPEASILPGARTRMPAAI